jgi:hypothetical protein
MTAWGDKADTLLEVSTGDELKVSFDVESREYNGRWYTDLKAWKIEPAAAGADSPSPSQQPVTGAQPRQRPVSRRQQCALPRRQRRRQRPAV